MTEKIIDNSAASSVSHLVSALRMGIEQISEYEQPEQQYGFKAAIDTPGVSLNNQDCDFEFTVPFDDDSIPNEATITVYNLTNDTINNLKKGNPLTITGGYKSDTGIILSGKISKVKTEHEGVDRITTIYVLDNADNKIVEQAFSENTAASAILKTLVDALGLPVEVFKIQRDHVFAQETAVKGSLYENIKKYSDICGVSTYINKQRVFCRPIWDGDNIHFIVSPDTGMIDSPEPFEETNTSEEYEDTVNGYKIKMLLQHRMNTAAIVDVNGRDYSGQFRVCSGEHSFDGISAVTEIKCIADISTTIVQKDESGLDSFDSDDSDSSGYSANPNITKDIMFSSKGTNTQEYLVLHTSCGPGASRKGIAQAVANQGLSIHGVIDDTGTLQTADWSARCWHCGNGNSVSIGFEQCENHRIKWNSNATVPSWNDSDNEEIKRYHDAMYGQAVALFAYLGKMFNIPTSKMVSHKEIGELKGGSDHGDPEELWTHFVRRWGDSKYTMNAFREAVAQAMASKSSPDTSGWVTGHDATCYGWVGDDNGICGWQSLRFREENSNKMLIDGCHVAIPTYCIKVASSYNSVYHKQDYPEFSGNYGEIIEVRSPQTGRSVKAVIADCGSFGPHNRYNHNTAIDLAPNTLNALGLSRDTHPIEYRPTGKFLKSWRGSQAEIENA